jgi:hypothetical protein
MLDSSQYPTITMVLQDKSAAAAADNIRDLTADKVAAPLGV